MAKGIEIKIFEGFSEESTDAEIAPGTIILFRNNAAEVSKNFLLKI